MSVSEAEKLQRIGFSKHILRGAHPAPAPGTHPVNDLW
jgi:hypothetical protein